METTLNINVDVMAKICTAAKANKLSCSKMIILLLKKAMNNITDPGRPGRLVRYQARKASESWHIFHITYREDDYEYVQDLRRLLKMSVSLLLAFAVDKFLHKKQTRITDSYQPRNYMIMREMIDNIISWRFIWGFPPNVERLLLPT
ncbi:MAG: hypothetical protein JW807_13780 [Spirochaetes bacterium]|nr:hypothetical protein [Spirochaetota bacterium]